MNFNSNPSLCIPRVLPSVTNEQVRYVINKLRIGAISKINMIHRKVYKTDGYQVVFIHFYHWYNSDEAIAIKNRIESGKELKVVYDFPWFWKISEYKPIIKNKQLTKALDLEVPNNLNLDLDSVAIPIDDQCDTPCSCY